VILSFRSCQNWIRGTSVHSSQKAFLSDDDVVLGLRAPATRLGVNVFLRPEKMLDFVFRFTVPVHSPRPNATMAQTRLLTRQVVRLMDIRNQKILRWSLIPMLVRLVSIHDLPSWLLAVARLSR
jgi:hypothetical protein